MNRPGEWSIQQLARITGTTSRTLRHYGSLGLLEPSRIGANGYRFYDQAALARLQRILLLRELGLGLAAIAADYGRAHAAGLAPDGPEVREITRRHYEWVAAGWQGRRPGADEFAGLAQMYVADPRFAANYDRHGEGTASFVSDAMLAFALDL